MRFIFGSHPCAIFYALRDVDSDIKNRYFMGIILLSANSIIDVDLLYFLSYYLEKKENLK